MITEFKSSWSSVNVACLIYWNLHWKDFSPLYVLTRSYTCTYYCCILELYSHSSCYEFVLSYAILFYWLMFMRTTYCIDIVEVLCVYNPNLNSPVVIKSTCLCVSYMCTSSGSSMAPSGLRLRSKIHLPYNIYGLFTVWNGNPVAMSFRDNNADKNGKSWKL